MMVVMSRDKTPALVHPTEVPAKRPRRSFSAEVKRRILAEADRCREPGEIGALLRREGIYSSHLAAWREARDRGELGGETPKRGPVPKAKELRRRDDRIAELERQNARLTKRAERAEALVELQKKVAEILGSPLPDPDETR